MEIHCDIPQDQAVRAQKKNDQLGGSKPRKGLKNRDPNKIIDQNSSTVVKPQQGSVSINLDNKSQKKKLGDVSSGKKHKSGKTSSKSPKVSSRPQIFADLDDIEASAGRLGIEEESFLSKQRMKKIPSDFPFPDPCKLEVVDKKMKVDDDISSLKPSLIDENEIDEILQKVDSKFGSLSDGGGEIERDFPICEVEFDLDFH